MTNAMGIHTVSIVGGKQAAGARVATIEQFAVASEVCKATDNRLARPEFDTYPASTAQLGDRKRRSCAPERVEDEVAAPRRHGENTVEEPGMELICGPMLVASSMYCRDVFPYVAGFNAPRVELVRLPAIVPVRLAAGSAGCEWTARRREESRFSLREVDQIVMHWLRPAGHRKSVGAPVSDRAAIGQPFLLQVGADSSRPPGQVIDEKSATRCQHAHALAKPLLDPGPVSTFLQGIRATVAVVDASIKWWVTKDGVNAARGHRPKEGQAVATVKHPEGRPCHRGEAGGQCFNDVSSMLPHAYSVIDSRQVLEERGLRRPGRQPGTTSVLRPTARAETTEQWRAS